MDLEILKWVANVAIGISALLVSFNVQLSTKWWPFIGFFIGHLLWIYAATEMDEMSLIALNGGFLLVDVYAMSIRFKLHNN